MRIAGLLATIAFSLSLFAPAAANTMTPTQMQAAVKTALQAAELTPRQKLQIKPMVQEYQQQTANPANASTKKEAQQALLKRIYSVLTPDQQAKFKASLKASMAQAQASP